MEQVMLDGMPLSLTISPEALVQLGIFQIKQGDCTNGEETLREVIMSSPRNAEAWMWLARMAAERQETRTAERCYLQAYRCGHHDALHELTALEARIETERAARRSLASHDEVSIEDRIINAVMFNRTRLIALVGIVLIVIVLVMASSPFP